MEYRLKLVIFQLVIQSMIKISYLNLEILKLDFYIFLCQIVFENQFILTNVFWRAPINVSDKASLRCLCFDVKTVNSSVDENLI